MNRLLQENNYIIVDDFLSVERADELFKTVKSDMVNYPHYFVYGDVQCRNSVGIPNNYGLFVELLVEKTPILGAIVEEIVLPTYTYARVYKKGAVLEPHTDREACEISITLHLGSDGVEWPIYFRKPDNSVVEVKMKPGQAVIYLGCVADHWRNEYQGDEYAQVFLHYVRSRGPNGKYYFDRRD